MDIAFAFRFSPPCILLVPPHGLTWYNLADTQHVISQVPVRKSRPRAKQEQVGQHAWVCLQPLMFLFKGLFIIGTKIWILREASREKWYSRLLQVAVI